MQNILNIMTTGLYLKKSQLTFNVKFFYIFSIQWKMNKKLLNSQDIYYLPSLFNLLLKL